MAKNLPEMQETRFDPWVRKIPWRREWLSIPVFLPGQLHGQRKLASYSSWFRRMSDATERLTLREGEEGGRMVGAGSRATESGI